MFIDIDLLLLDWGWEIDVLGFVRLYEGEVITLPAKLKHKQADIEHVHTYTSTLAYLPNHTLVTVHCLAIRTLGLFLLGSHHRGLFLCFIGFSFRAFFRVGLYVRLVHD